MSGRIKECHIQNNDGKLKILCMSNFELLQRVVTVNNMNVILLFLNFVLFCKTIRMWNILKC